MTVFITTPERPSSSLWIYANHSRDRAKLISMYITQQNDGVYLIYCKNRQQSTVGQNMCFGVGTRNVRLPGANETFVIVGKPPHKIIIIDGRRLSLLYINI